MQPDILNVRNLSIEDQVTYFASLAQEEENSMEVFIQLDPKVRSQTFKFLPENIRTLKLLVTEIPYINRATNFRYIRVTERTFENLLALRFDSQKTRDSFVYLNDYELNLENFYRLDTEQRNIDILLSLNLNLEEKSKHFGSMYINERTTDNLKRFGQKYWSQIFPQLRKRYRTMPNLLEMEFSPEIAANIFRYLKDNQRTLENLLLFPHDKLSPERISPRAIAFEFLLDQYQKIEYLVRIDKRDRRYCLQRIRNIHAALASPTLFQSFGEVDSERFFKKFYSRLG
ncbi:MAG: hypothetical protein LBJ93_02055, partial [Clostridiales bacterium]|nr:hypothetical protein [Clostridiales bacterium]